MNLSNMVVKNDNIGVQKLSANPVFYARTKHVDKRYHFVRDAIKKKLIMVEHVPTREMTAHILTKGLSRVGHEDCVKGLGLKRL